MILLSFDIEEFDMPLEYGKEIDFPNQMNLSMQGTQSILNLLKKYNVKATFFTTANFAIHAPHLINQIIEDGHEIASHSYYHSNFSVEDLKKSKDKLQEISKSEVIGFRMPRMQPVDEKEIYNAGYIYNSSINPTYLPGRYNNFSKPRTYFYFEKVLQIPASVSPIIRFPLFWLSFHNLPLWLYKWLCKITYSKDKYLNIYFHPWEFMSLQDKYNFPKYVSKNSGDKMVLRLENLILWMKFKKYPFGTFKDFIIQNKISEI